MANKGENKLTDTGLKRLRLTNGKALALDGGGLRAVVIETEKRRVARFTYRFRLNGARVDMRMGTWPDRSLAEIRDARDKARDLARRGIDPREAARQAKAEAARLEAEKRARLTVRQLYEKWEALHLASAYKDSGREVRRYFEKDIFPDLGDLPAAALTRAHVARVVDGALERGAPRTAALNLTYLRQMCHWGLSRGHLEHDPTAAMRKRGIGPALKPRERILSDDEIRELARLLPKAGLPHWAPSAIWLLLATAARGGELLRTRWENVDLPQGKWTIPAENSKNGRAHLVHLSDFACARFAELAALRAGEWVIGGRKPGHPVEPKAIAHALRDRQRGKGEAIINKRTERFARALVLPGGSWTPHDLRRTAATLMQGLGVLPAVIEKALNHTEPRRVVATYQRAEYLPERRDAFARLGDHLDRLAEGEPGTVALLRPAAGADHG